MLSAGFDGSRGSVAVSVCPTWARCPARVASTITNGQKLVLIPQKIIPRLPANSWLRSFPEVVWEPSGALALAFPCSCSHAAFHLWYKLPTVARGSRFPAGHNVQLFRARISFVIQRAIFAPMTRLPVAALAKRFIAHSQSLPSETTRWIRSSKERNDEKQRHSF